MTPLKQITVFTRLNAAAFILAFSMRRLFKGGVYFNIFFLIKITDNNYGKSFVNIM